LGAKFTNCITNNIAFGKKLAKTTTTAAAAVGMVVEVLAGLTSHYYKNRKLWVVLKNYFKFAKNKSFFYFYFVTK
jgi:hypothetical protein